MEMLGNLFFLLKLMFPVASYFVNCYYLKESTNFRYSWHVLSFFLMLLPFYIIGRWLVK